MGQEGGGRERDSETQRYKQREETEKNVSALEETVYNSTYFSIKRRNSISQKYEYITSFHLKLHTDNADKRVIRDGSENRCNFVTVYDKMMGYSIRRNQIVFIIVLPATYSK